MEIREQGDLREIGPAIEYKTGNFEVAENTLLLLKKEAKNINPINLIAVNNFLGVINMELGKNNKSIEYYNNNLKIFYSLLENDIRIYKTYNNLANIYQVQGKYIKAERYYNKAINIINTSNLPIDIKKKETAGKYYNLGVVYFKTEKYKKAIEYFNRSFSIKKAYNLKGIDKIYFNLARCYIKLNNIEKSNSCFISSIKLMRNDYGKEYYRLAPLYMNYGDFLRKTGKFKQAKIYLEKAKSIYERNYTLKHPYTADSYVYTGKYYLSVQKNDSALYWFQKSLIANSKTFQSEDYTENPNPKDCFSGLQLLRSLKFKAKAIHSAASEKSNLFAQSKLYYNSLKTLNTALRLISEIRKEYNSAESKLIITEEEKECYSLCVNASVKLSEITNSDVFREVAYQYASAAKASVMNDLSEEEREFKKTLPDSLFSLMKNKERKISIYKKSVYEEKEKIKPDSLKISFWNSVLFDLNNDYEAFIKKIKSNYHISENPDKQIISVSEIQERLNKNTEIAEYFISKNPESDKQVLYIFVISKNKFSLKYFDIDGSFFQDIRIYKNAMNTNSQKKSDIYSYNRLNKASYELYKKLIEPVKYLLKDKNIIIVPDEETAFISFESLISGYKVSSSINYAEIPYLIYDYCFSYAYSAPLYLKNKNKKDNSGFVYAFAPDYKKTKNTEYRYQPGNLVNTKKEIKSVLSRFNGKAYTGASAKCDSFKSVTGKGGILHLAMHAVSEENNKDFSFLAFSGNQNKTGKDKGFLYAYEIENMNINSPLVVLSACNTGTGKLYSGEGVMSLSRSFIKSGVPAVINSLWNVNDNAGFKIMKSFYENLSQGKTKNVSLREAKLAFIKDSPPSLINPKYWSGYVLTGDISPVKHTDNKLFYLADSLAFLFAFLLVIFFRNIKH